MSDKKNVAKTKINREKRPSWLNIALALTLLPLASGILLIIAWAMDFSVFGRLESQAFFGLFLILISFTLSNLFQKKWGLFLGWLLLSAADVLLLNWVSFVVQIIAFGMLGVGLIILVVAFYRQLQSSS